MSTEGLFYSLVLTPEGYRKWGEGKPLEVTDVKPEFRAALASNFIGAR